MPLPLLLRAPTSIEQLLFLRRILPAVCLGVFGVVVFANDPADGGFPMCPFHYLTGLLCPGCGSQRGLHDLLHGRISDAFGHNALLVISVPLLVAQWGAGKVLTGRSFGSNNYVVYGWLVLVIGWWVARNLMV